ncbi:interleukin-34 isoform X2 [Dasypus novemcinctus]|uniref:interleukin-34 isoform X2 n=1 Tax=Dasypus novemcinctus TaxID=9361 RepID=UPI00265EA17F|nr:interleukin-34 isoform X2 [Dasypus novemcinctus]
MPRGYAWLRYLGILLGVALGNEDLTPSEECVVTGFLRDKLQYRNRLQYMKHYFPINYRIVVPYEGVLRIANVTRLKAQVSEQELRYLWVWVSLSTTELVQEVLLEGHPSWKYLEDVQALLLDVQRGLTVNRAPWSTGRTARRPPPGPAVPRRRCSARPPGCTPRPGRPPPPSRAPGGRQQHRWLRDASEGGGHTRPLALSGLRATWVGQRRAGAHPGAAGPGIVPGQPPLERSPGKSFSLEERVPGKGSASTFGPRVASPGPWGARGI